ncbi:MAG: ABC-F family ATP-binding cassette domain-containing protein [Planctomycetota bacterium]
MVLLSAENIKLAFGATIILDGASIDVNHGDRIGLVGPNGCGKTTLIDCIVGVREIDSGSIQTAKNAKIGFISQTRDYAPGARVRDVAVRAFEPTLNAYREMEALLASHPEPGTLTELEAKRRAERLERLESIFHSGGGYDIDHRVDKHLTMLGFDAEMQARDARTLSGGEALRLDLCRVLLEEPDILVLDEPTNHLDIDALDWLQSLLTRENKTLLVVSHDRWFLDSVCTHICELSGGKARRWKGNFTAYCDQRAAEQALRLKRKLLQDEFLAKEEAYIRKHLAGQLTRQAKGRRKRIERVERIEVLSDVGTEIRLKIPVKEPSGNDVFKIVNLRIGFGDKPLLEPLTATELRGQKIGICGGNGTGKSTLLKALAGEIPLISGTIKTGHNVQLGFHRQEAAQSLRGDVIDVVRSVAPSFTPEQARSFLGIFLFSGNDVFKSCNQLSGGEAGRLSLARLCLEGFNTLFLDEPTNHLDIYMRESLEDALRDYDGTLIIVSHDRRFLDAVTDRTWWIVDGRLHDIDRGFSEARDWLATRTRAVAEPVSGTASAMPAEPARAKPRKINQYKLDRIEERMMTMEARRSELESSMLEPANYSDGQKMQNLARQLDAVKKELLSVESEWSELIDSADG